MDIGFSSRLIFDPHVTAVNRQFPCPVDGHKGPGPRDLLQVIVDRPLLQGLYGVFEFAQPLIDLVGILLGLGVFGFQRLEFVLQLRQRRSFLVRHRARDTGQLPQAHAEAIRQVDSHFDPLPAFFRHRLGAGGQFLRHELVEQGHVLEPAAPIAFEEIAQNGAPSRFVSRGTYERGATVFGAHTGLRQHAPDLVGVLRPGRFERLPDLALTVMIRIHREGHELFESHVVLGVNVEQGRGHGRKFEPLPDHLRRHEERGRDLLLALPFLAQRHEGPKLVQRMQRGALQVLGERVIFGGDLTVGIADNAGNWRVLRKPLLFHQQGEGLVPPPTGRDLVFAAFLPAGIQNRPRMQALKETSPGDVFREFFDGDARLDLPNIGLAQHELVESDIAGRREGDFLGRFGHLVFSSTGAGSLSPDPQTRQTFHSNSLTLRYFARSYDRGHMRRNSVV